MFFRLPNVPGTPADTLRYRSGTRRVNPGQLSKLYRSECEVLTDTGPGTVNNDGHGHRAGHKSSVPGILVKTTIEPGGCFDGNITQ